MKIWFFLLTFLIGVVLGVSGTYLAPDLIRPYLPEAIQGKSVTVEGTVVAKQRKQAWLLLTINTNQGALLATFKKRGEEIELLVNKGDTVEFVLRRYEPFVEDPVIKRVKKEKPQPQIQLEESSPLPPQQEGDIPLPSLPEDEEPLHSGTEEKQDNLRVK